MLFSLSSLARHRPQVRRVTHTHPLFMASASNASCALCALSELPTASTYDASRTTPVVRRKCKCGVNERPLLIDVGTASASKRPDAANWVQHGPKGWRVLAFEALPSNCASVAPLLGKYGPDRARFLCKAVGDSVGNVTLHTTGMEDTSSLAPMSAAAVFAAAAPSAQIVPLTTLDVEVGKQQHVWFLKVDVQGVRSAEQRGEQRLLIVLRPRAQAEYHALRGARRLLHEQRISWIFLEFDPILLRQHSSPGRPSSGAALLGLLERNDFACVNVRSRTWRPRLSWDCSGLSDELHLRTHTNQTCVYSDLLCGHRSVAAPPARSWKSEVWASFCRPGRWVRAGKPEWSQEMCETPHGHERQQPPGAQL